MLDHYASRAQWLQQFPNILQLNHVQFASSTFYVTKGDLRRRPKEVVIKTFPHWTCFHWFQSSVSSHTTKTFGMGRSWPKTLSPATTIETTLLHNHSQVPGADLVTSSRHWHWESRKSPLHTRCCLSAHIIPETSINIKQQTIARETKRRLKITRPSSDHSPAFPTLKYLQKYNVFSKIHLVFTHHTT